MSIYSDAFGAPPSVASFLLGPSLWLLFLGWAIVATTLALRSGPMERSRLTDPLQATRGFGAFEPALSSFEAYKATYDRARSFGPRGEGTPTAPPSDEELRRQYEGLRADRIASNRFEGRRALVSAVLLLALAAGLFVAHWRWLRRRSDEVPAVA